MGQSEVRQSTAKRSVNECSQTRNCEHECQLLMAKLIKDRHQYMKSSIIANGRALFRILLPVLSVLCFVLFPVLIGALFHALFGAVFRAVRCLFGLRSTLLICSVTCCVPRAIPRAVPRHVPRSATCSLSCLATYSVRQNVPDFGPETSDQNLLGCKGVPWW